MAPEQSCVAQGSPSLLSIGPPPDVGGVRPRICGGRGQCLEVGLPLRGRNPFPPASACPFQLEPKENQPLLPSPVCPLGDLCSIRPLRESGLSAEAREGGDSGARTIPSHPTPIGEPICRTPAHLFSMIRLGALAGCRFWSLDRPHRHGQASEISLWADLWTNPMDRPCVQILWTWAAPSFCAGGTPAWTEPCSLLGRHDPLSRR